MNNKDCSWSDMDNISVVNGEIIDYEYEQQKINAEKTKKLKKFWFGLIVWFVFILPLAVSVIRIFTELAGFAGRYS